MELKDHVLVLRGNLVSERREVSVTHAKTQLGAAQSKDVEVSVAIPCLNEAESIAFCIDKALTALRGAGIRGLIHCHG